MLWKQAASSADDDRDGDEEFVRSRVFARAFTVFNLAQVEGYEPEPVALLPETERVAHADAFVEALKIPFTDGPYDAHYRIDLDRIFMPLFAAFRDAASHIATLVHECGHATGLEAPSLTAISMNGSVPISLLWKKRLLSSLQATSWPTPASPIIRTPSSRRPEKLSRPPTG